MKSVIALTAVLMLASHLWAALPPERPVARPEKPLAHFVAKVKWIKMVGEREVTVVPIGGIDLNWMVGIEILAIEKANPTFAKKGKTILLIHSPAMFFPAVNRKKIPGGIYSFKIFGEVKEGVPRYTGAEVTEVTPPGRKT